MAKVLVVDHSEGARKLIKAALEKSGHTVLAVDSADLAVNALKNTRHDLVLLDMHLPGKDGLTCLAMIRADPAISATPVFLITGAVPREVILKVAKLGVAALVLKNGNWAVDMFERVAKLLASPTTPASATTRTPATTSPASAAPATPAAPAPPPKPSIVRRRKGAMSDEAALEHLADLTPVISRTQLMEHMQADTVRSRALRPVAEEVVRFSQGTETSVQALAAIIRLDQALSLLVLKMANSPDYEDAMRVDSVIKAVARIGLDHIYEVVKTTPVVDAFNGAAKDGWFRHDWFWEHGFACGTLAMRIAEALHRPREYCDTIFSAGMLHDIGRLLLVEHLSEHHPRVAEAFDRLELPLELIEARLLILNHAEIAEKLMRHWNLAPSMILPVACHQMTLASISSTAPRAIDEVVPLALANRIAHCMLLGTSGNEVLYPIEEFIDHLNIPGRTLQDVIKKVRTEVAETRANMLASGGSSGSYLDAMKDLLGAVRPLPLSLRPEIDPVAIMCESLRDGSTLENPNLLTLRICNPKDRATSVKLIDQAIENTPPGESSRSNLPVLVIGDSKSCLLNETLIGKRRVRQVTLPRTFSRLFSDMSDLIRS